MATARSIPEIFTDLLRQFTALMRTEARLARAEVSENLSAAAVGLGLVVIGAVLLIPGLVVLLEAAVAALQKYGLESYWAALAVGGGAPLIGFILMAVGMRRLSVRRLVPSRTLEQIQQDANVAREQARSDHDQVQRAA
jgi:Putative Actinobacterial Holin-X, holin superfamily III